jgi:hypothetical protein
MFQIILALASCGILAIFALVLGSVISSYSKKSEVIFKPESYFLGLSSLLILMRLLYIPLNNLRVTIFLTFILTLVYILASTRKLAATIREVKFNATMVLVLSTLALTHLTMALVPITEFDQSNIGFLDPWGGHSTLVHSFRASNLAVASNDLNAFPVVNQNVSQSMLALLIMIPTNLAPLGIFPIQMVMTLLFLTVLIAKILANLGTPKKLSIIFALFILFMNSSIGSVYTSATDTGSALFLLKSHDALLGIGIFLSISNYLFENRNLLGRPGKLRRNLVTPCILVASLPLVFGSYAFLIPLIVMALPIGIDSLQNRRKSRHNEESKLIQTLKARLILSCYLFLSFLSIASISGFIMLVNSNLEVIPSSERGPLSPGLRNLFEPQNFVWPREAWYSFSVGGGYQNALDSVFSISKLDAFRPRVGFSQGFEATFEFSKSLLVVVLCLVLGELLIRLLRSQLTPFHTYLWRIAKHSFFAGTFITLWVKAGPDGSLSRELSRFLHVGIFLTFLLAVNFGYIFYKQQRKNVSNSNKVKGLLLLIVLILSTVSTVSEVLRITTGNLGISSSQSHFGCTVPSNSFSRVLELNERIELLLKSKALNIGGKC